MTGKFGSKGQAAMEYLMTYGWALLVIVIVIAILLIMNPFSAPQSCKFDQIGFACENAVVTTGGLLLMGVTNGNNNAINVSGVTCTSVKSSVAPSTVPVNFNVIVSRQGTLNINTTNNVACSGAPATKGADFSGKIWIFYKNTEDGVDYPTRSASANIVTKVI